MIALAACYTDATATGDPSSFAAALIAHGASVVLGTETSVTDIYATRMFTRIYESLVNTESPDVIDAVADARRAIQRQLLASPDRRDQHLAGLDEWAVVTVLASAGSAVLLDPAAGPAQPATPSRSGPVVAGLLAREVGEFVGRRRAQRRWPTELLAPGAAGLVVHGIGGVGKTTLASELIRRITDRDPQRITVVGASGVTGGETSVDRILTELGRALRFRLRTTGTDDMRAAAALALQPDEDWQYRLAVLRDYILNTIPVLLVLDNFEDNLTLDNPPDQPDERTVRDPALAELLAVLAATPGRCRLLITSRYPFLLPRNAHRALTRQHLGALSVAETMKLAWALPALDRLAEADLARVCRLVGGHPRSLEYLDALLLAGKGAYPDVTTRLTTALRDRLDTEDLTDWFTHHRDLDPAIAEVITLAADDVLLPQLLATLEDTPGAVELLLGVSVYRTPVELAGVLFQIGEPDPAAAHTPDPRGAQQQILDILRAAGVAVEESLDISVLPVALQHQLGPHLAEIDRLPTPPRRGPDNLTHLVETCAASSLITLDTDGSEPRVFVHRWTATELHRRWTARGHTTQLTAAHHRAAQYWRWRAQVWPQDPATDVEDTLEARHHLLEAGQPDQAGTLTETICTQLYSWGAWDRAEALIHDTITRLPTSSDRRVGWNLMQSDIAAGRGRTRRATELCQQALAIAEGLVHQDPANPEFQRWLSVSYNRLGDLARAAGDISEATRLYQQCLTIREGLAARDPANTDFQRDLSISYERLADLAHRAGRQDEARTRLSGAAEIRTGLHRREPQRVDLAEELAVTLRQLINTTDEIEPSRSTALGVLDPIEQKRLLTPKGTAVLGWLRELE